MEIFIKLFGYLETAWLSISQKSIGYFEIFGVSQWLFWNLKTFGVSQSFWVSWNFWGISKVIWVSGNFWGISKRLGTLKLWPIVVYYHACFHGEWDSLGGPIFHENDSVFPADIQDILTDQWVRDVIGWKVHGSGVFYSRTIGHALPVKQWGRNVHLTYKKWCDECVWLKGYHCHYEEWQNFMDVDFHSTVTRFAA